MTTCWPPLSETRLTLVYQSCGLTLAFCLTCAGWSLKPPVRIVFCLLHNRQALGCSAARLQGVPARCTCDVCVLSISGGQDFHEPTYFRFPSLYTAGTGSKHSHLASTMIFPKSALTWALMSRRKWFNTDRYVQWQFCSMKRAEAYSFLTLPPTQHAALPARVEDVMAHPWRPIQD